jgi:hypothetical protein
LTSAIIVSLLKMKKWSSLKFCVRQTCYYELLSIILPADTTVLLRYLLVLLVLVPARVLWYPEEGTSTQVPVPAVVVVVVHTTVVQ